MNATTTRVRLADIAEDVGVSVQVVSAVINGRGPSSIGASEETRRRIREAADRLGYRRNAAAASLRRGRHGRIGVLMAGAEAGVFLPQGVLAGMTDAFAKAGVGLTLDSVVLAGKQSLRQSRLVQDDCVDALVLALSEQPSRHLIRKLREIGQPVLWMHQAMAYSAISYDEAGAAAAIVDHLAERGHRTIHFVDLNQPKGDVLAPKRRAAGYEAACRRHGIQPRLDYEHRVYRDVRAEFAADWLKRHPEPTSLIVGSCTAAQVFLDVAHQLGRSVPDSLALASFDSGNLCTANAPWITAAIFPERDLGLAAGEMAIELTEHPDQRLTSRLLPCNVQVGGTT
ncbi:MAG: LacI family DNA-binding transcriptional regulator [Planctomycetota bacterium]